MFNFPSSPTEGQEFTPPDGPTYVWTAPVWTPLVGSGGGGGTVDAWTKTESDARYEPVIAPGDGTLFWAGDKTWKGPNWNAITGKPATFPPAAHTHAAVDVVDFSEAVDDRVSVLLQQGTNITLAYNDTAGTLTINAAAGGGAATAVADTPPGSPVSGQLWVNSTSMAMNVWYTDPNTSQWVEVGASNAGPTATISTSAPSGGADGDVWYQVP
jgi:hypothetical protein